MVRTWTNGCAKLSTVSSRSVSVATGCANSSTLKPSILERGRGLEHWLDREGMDWGHLQVLGMPQPRYK